MNKLEREILKEVVAEFYKLSEEKATVWSELVILEKNIPRLPDGEIKKFFQKIKEDRNLAYQTVKGKNDLKSTETALKILIEIQNRLEKGDFPQGIPQEIIQLYRQVLALEMFAGKLAKQSLEKDKEGK